MFHPSWLLEEHQHFPLKWAFSEVLKNALHRKGAWLGQRLETLAELPAKLDAKAAGVWTRSWVDVDINTSGVYVLSIIAHLFHTWKRCTVAIDQSQDKVFLLGLRQAPILENSTAGVFRAFLSFCRPKCHYDRLWGRTPAERIVWGQSTSGVWFALPAEKTSSPFARHHSSREFGECWKDWWFRWKIGYSGYNASWLRLRIYTYIYMIMCIYIYIQMYIYIYTYIYQSLI